MKPEHSAVYAQVRRDKAIGRSIRNAKHVAMGGLLYVPMDINYLRPFSETPIFPITFVPFPSSLCTIWRAHRTFFPSRCCFSTVPCDHGMDF